MLLDPTTDYDVFDCNVAVTVARSDGSLTVYGVAATQGGLSTQERVFGAAVGLLPTDRTFILYASTTEGLVPIPGDVVTEHGGTAWTVVTVDERSYGGLPDSYRVIVRRRL